MTTKQVRKAIRDADRQEWIAFLALVPLFDLSQIDEQLLDRCAGWLAESPERVRRGEIKLHSGLWFADDGAFDLVLARLILEGRLEAVRDEPGCLLVKNRGSKR